MGRRTVVVLVHYQIAYHKSPISNGDEKSIKEMQQSRKWSYTDLGFQVEINGSRQMIAKICWLIFIIQSGNILYYKRIKSRHAFSAMQA